MCGSVAEAKEDVAGCVAMPERNNAARAAKSSKFPMMSSYEAGRCLAYLLIIFVRLDRILGIN